MYAAQFFAAAGESLGDFDQQFAGGDFAPLKNWMNEHIHRPGKKYRANRLVQVVSGRSLSSKPLLEHLHAKFDELYAL